VKYKVSELEGALLDAAVARAEGDNSPISVTAAAGGRTYWSPSTDWQYGGPIIERFYVRTKFGDEVDLP
jgi:hypothetical protein